MNSRSSAVLRRYAPLLVVLAAIGFLIGVLPSTAPGGGAVVAGAGGSGGYFQSPYAAGSGTGPNQTATTVAGALG
ncbi:MAG TPA: hypothetical protein VFH70_08305, partial [Acidimicrobiales bacterium]|nr:hypothetical protein [Acidimicrobiales bacterium]